MIEKKTYLKVKVNQGFFKVKKQQQNHLFLSFFGLIQYTKKLENLKKILVRK